MLVYDVTQVETFHNIPNWLRKISSKVNENVQINLVANKCDMKDKRQVPKEKAEAFAQDLAIPFFEVSAKSKTNNNIERAFTKMAELIMDNTIID